MGTPENNAKTRESKSKVNMKMGKPKNQHLLKKTDFAPQSKFTRVFGALTCKTFYGHQPNDFNAPMNSSTIYVRNTYDHKMGITRKEMTIWGWYWFSAQRGR